MIRPLRSALAAGFLLAAGLWAPAQGLDVPARGAPACAMVPAGVLGGGPLLATAPAAPRATGGGWLAAEPERTGGPSDPGSRACREGARPSGAIAPSVRGTRAMPAPRRALATTGLLGLPSAPANAPPGS